MGALDADSLRHVVEGILLVGWERINVLQS